MRNISAWSIRNPIFSIVLFAALTLAGFVSFMRMSLNQNPEITFPAVVINVSQPGAAPTELETQVTQRVEAAVRNLEGVEDMSSTVSEGVSQTFVQFTIETPVDRATTDVRDAISQIRAQLPDGIIEPQISRVIINQNSLANYVAQGTDMTMEQLSWYVLDTVSRRLLAVDGMQQVGNKGAVQREIRVVLDPARMQAQGITAAQVNQQLRLINTNAAGGRAEIANAEQSVRVLGNSQNAYTLSQTQLQLADGRSIKLGDIATVRDSFGEQRSIAKMDGKPVVSFGLYRSRGASDVTVYNAATKVLAQLEKENPKVHFIQRANNVKYTLQNYRVAMRAMIEGAVLAVAVVFLFLRDRRATIISALAIPLSAIPTFWIMTLMGFTLNFMTLLALSLVAGVLVDDAIVEIENIVRHMRMGKSAYQASIDAADEIGLAVVGTTFSIVAVFLPVGMMPGVAGQFFMNFGITIVVSVLMSLAVARLITPMIAAYFLKSAGGDLFEECTPTSGKYRAGYDNEAGRDTLKLYIDAMFKHKIHDPKLKQDAEGLANQQAAMFVRESWLVGYMKKNAPAVQYAVAPLPAYKKTNTLLFWTNLYVTRSSKQPKEAWDFIMFMANGPKLKELEDILYNTVGWMPPRNDVVKRHPSIYTDVPQYKYFAEVPKGYELYAYPRLAVTDESFTKLAERLVKAYQDKSLLDNPTGIAKAIHEAAEETNEILKENKLYCGR